jgi:hypothetical protein
MLLGTVVEPLAVVDQDETNLVPSQEPIRLRLPHLQEVEEERDKQKKGANRLPFSSPE